MDDWPIWGPSAPLLAYVRPPTWEKFKFFAPTGIRTRDKRVLSHIWLPLDYQPYYIKIFKY